MSRSPSRGRSGAALLEVLLAVALFAAAAAIVTSALNASMGSLERQRLGLQALNLAASTLAEIQLGIRPAANQGQQPFPAPMDAWTAEVLTSPMEQDAATGPSSLARVEVVIRHRESPVVQRLGEVVLAQPSTNGAPTAPSTPGGTTP
jgi:type II secretory pathway pseudopilin PulG